MSVVAYAPQPHAVPACGVLLAGEVAGVGRFRNDAQLARLVGVAPIDASSGM